MAVLTKTIDAGVYHVESVDRIEFTIKKDGELWLNIDSVVLSFRSPDGTTIFNRSMVLDSGAVWYYDTAVTDFIEVGSWTVKVTITDGAIVKSYPYEVGFEVTEQP